MADRSAIEWTDASWNPIRARVMDIQSDGSGKERIGWHCEHISDGCRNCYAEAFNRRLGTGRDFKPGERFRDDKVGYNNGEVKVFLEETMLTQPLRWKKPRKIFVCSMTDAFADFVTDEMLDRMFAVMALAPQHTFQVLTKRAERMQRWFAPFDRRRADGLGTAVLQLGYTGPLELLPWPLPNVWLGISAERQAEADERIPLLLETPAAKRFISAEPLLGPIDLHALPFPKSCDCEGHSPRLNSLDASVHCAGCCEGPEAIDIGKLDWVIAGGESGRNARAMHPDWARGLRDQCRDAGVAFFFKQWGEWAPSTPEEAEANPHSGWQAMAAHPHVAKAAELYPEAGAKFVARVGKKAAGRLLDGIEHSDFPKVPA